MRRIVIFLFFSLALQTACSVQAATGSAYAISCNGCDSRSAKLAAQSIAPLFRHDPSRGYLGYVYVYDFNIGNIDEYGIQSNEKHGLTAWLMGSAPIDIQNDFSMQRNAILANRNSPNFVFNDTSSNYPGAFPVPDASAIDIVQTSAYQNYISNWMSSSASKNAWSVVNAVSSLILKDQPITFTVTFTLDDGSKIVMEFKAGETKWTLIAAYDQNLNTIPFTIDQVTGRYIFPRGGSEPFGNYLHERFGLDILDVPVCHNGYLACYGVKDMKTCAWVNCSGF